MAVEITVADRVEIEAIRGVRYYEEFSLFENDGTEASPITGAALDLTDWPWIVAMMDVIVDQTLVRAIAAHDLGVRDTNAIVIMNGVRWGA